MEIREVWKHRAASERHVWRAGKRAVANESYYGEDLAHEY